jgi:murein DD-endopeptidase MepM/ murein hydrolase activator NlpD
LRIPKEKRRSIVYATAALLLTGSTFMTWKHLHKADPQPDHMSFVGSTAVHPELGENSEETAKDAPADKAPAAASATAEILQANKTEKFETYTVKSGDTVSGIAVDHNLKTDSLLDSNSLSEATTLQIGQELVIPRVDGVVYEVESGDYLYALASDFNVDVSAIAQANPDVNPDNLQPGQKLLIPGGRRDERSRNDLASRGSKATHRLAYWPAVGPLTDDFGWRIHPVYGTKSFHDGMDIGVSSGTPVRAALGGTITMAARNGGYGLAIRIDHGGGLATEYAHLSQIDVKVGQDVKAGEHIGYSGNTGVSTGPHLHFMMLVDDSPVDPMSWLP